MMMTNLCGVIFVLIVTAIQHVRKQICLYIVMVAMLLHMKVAMVGKDSNDKNEKEGATLVRTDPFPSVLLQRR